MDTFEHHKPLPPEQAGEKGPQHKIELKVDGEVVGHATLEYYSKPFPLYYIEWLEIDENRQGEGYGRKIMDYVEAMLREKGKAGVLIDAVKWWSPAKGMYQRRGWNPVLEGEDDWNLFVYNLPKGADVSELKEYSDRFYRM